MDHILRAQTDSYMDSVGAEKITNLWSQVLGSI